ncbi:MAG: molybdopterin-dependent oxidoreductase [Sulfuricurvum sp.]|nr:molybdopterin-dependent oxidoreductase [Sulfuricurvum sp.]
MELSRRTFLKNTALVTSAFIVGFYLPVKANAAEDTKETNRLKPNAFIQIDADNTITFFMGQAEMGQGTYTALAMCIADELDAHWEAVHFKASGIDPVYNSVFGPWMLTAGSTSISTKQLEMRQVGAAVNLMLKKAAAARWNTDLSNIKTHNSEVMNLKTGDKFTYGELVSDIKTMSIPQDPELKALKDCSLIGKPTRRHPSEAWAKVTGQAEYGVDVRMENLKYAAVLHPAVFGAKIVSFDASKALKRNGIIKIKQIPNGISVIAEHWFQAKEALNYIDVVWDKGEFAKISTKDIRKKYDALLHTPGASMRRDGDTAKAFKEAHSIISADYEFPFLAHAPMEPLNCTVHHTGDSAKMWTGGQVQTVYQKVCADILGLKPEAVEYNNTFLGGGFGRRAAANADYINDAVYTAKDEAWPIMTLWTREDDIRMGNYRPMYKNKARVALNKHGDITAFEAKVVGQPVVKDTILGFLFKDGVDWAQWDGLTDHPYSIANHDMQAHSPSSPIPVLWWRSVGHTQTAPLVEGIVDEAAYKAGVDPIAYRISMLEDLRCIKLLEDVAKISDWKNRKKEKNIGYGVALVKSFGSIVAQVAKVKVSKNDFKVLKVWCSVDCGFAINPLNIENQMISGINFGLAPTKYSEITIKNGEAEQNNFYDYLVTRISDAPDIQVSIVNSGDKIGGIGETAVPPIFPAVANAIFDATGKRYHSLPIKIS